MEAHAVPARRLDSGTTFAILGAGAAGLTAARTLLEAGYRDVTVIDAEPEAGGKCCSVEVDGKPFDLGCLAGSREDYHDVLRLAAAHGTGAVDFTVRHFSMARGGEVPLFSPGERLRLVREYLTCAWLHLTWRGVRRGEMVGLSDELCGTFAEVVERRGLHGIEKKTRGMFIACGFGAPEDFPAAYAANYASPRIMLSPDSLFTWRHGAQALWQREAAALAERGVRFRLATRVTDICRDAQVQLGVDDGSAFTVDELIVAADPTSLPLDRSPDEAAVFDQVRHNDYRVLLCRIGGLPAASGPTMHFIEDNLVGGRAGRPMALFRRHAELDVCAVYVYGDGLDDATLLGNLERDLRAVGMRLEAHLDGRAWTRYFPHFDGAALRAGALEALYALQGRRHTTWVGELLNFAILPRIMDNARLTIERLIAGDQPGRNVPGAT